MKNYENLKASDNTYDWLGNGIYFWENSYQRAYDWAASNSKYKEPAVLGAVIDLGYCLNLTDYHSAEVLKRGYEMLKIKYATLGEKLPHNRVKDKMEMSFYVIWTALLSSRFISITKKREKESMILSEACLLKERKRIREQDLKKKPIFSYVL